MHERRAADDSKVADPQEASARPMRTFITLLCIGAIIFPIELAVMGVLPWIPVEEFWLPVADALLLSVIAAPFLYVLGFRARHRTGAHRVPIGGDRLFRHFAVVSVAAVLLVMLLVGSGLGRILRTYVINDAKNDAIPIARMLREVETASLVTNGPDGRETLAVAPEQISQIDERMAGLLAPFDTVKIKIFDRTGRIVYSTDHSIIGERNAGNERLNAALGGEAVSVLKRKGEQRDLANESRTDIDLVETYVAVTDADGRIVGAMEIYQDVTANVHEGNATLLQAIAVILATMLTVFGILAAIMRRASAAIQARTLALESSEKRTRAIVDTAGDGIITIDERGIIESFNAAAESIFGYDARAVVGRDVGMLMPAPHRERHGQYLARYCRSGDARIMGAATEVCGQHKDGSSIPIELTVSEVLVGGRRTFTAILRDITERKHAEKARLRLIEAEHERNELQEAVAAQDQMLGVVGHELRTPLAALRATTEFLLTDEAREMQEFGTFLKSINEEVVRMSGMVGDLLDAARLNSGRARWNWGSVDVMEACEAALNEVRPLADRDRVVVDCSIDPPDLRMAGDAQAVRRLILNLADNARKHTREGSITVTAHAIEMEGGPGVQIEIRDTGEGIAPEIADRLGTAFALNAGMAGTRYTEGTGLGIAICKGIVAAHGGSMSIKSAQGEGTTVTVQLRSDLAQAVSDAGDVAIDQEIAA